MAARVWQQAAPWLFHSKTPAYRQVPACFSQRALHAVHLFSPSPTTCDRTNSHYVRASMVLAAVAPAQAEESPPSPSINAAQPQEESGPVELPSDLDPFAMPSESSPLQSAGSILFTGVLAIFLFRALRRRAKLVKEKKFRSTGLENAEGPVTPSGSDANAATPPSALQAFQGAVLAGAISFVLFKFAILIEASFASKPVSTVYTIRQLTITIRTILNGLCYLATFVFAANSIGLMVYSLQLLFNVDPKDSTQTKGGIEADAMEKENLEEAKKE